jgi:hypothetical protein
MTPQKRGHSYMQEAQPNVTSCFGKVEIVVGGQIVVKHISAQKEGGKEPLHGAVGRSG